MPCADGDPALYTMLPVETSAQLPLCTCLDGVMTDEVPAGVLFSMHQREVGVFSPCHCC